jgi:recombinational DNA repair protein (RecF pathway)
LTNCVNCGGPVGDRSGIFFAPSRGGVVCRNCQAGFPDRIGLDIRLLRLLQMIQPPAPEGSVRRLPQLSRHQTDPLNLLLAEHIQHALGQRLRTAYYILSGRRLADVEVQRQFACNSMGRGA